MSEEKSPAEEISSETFTEDQKQKGSDQDASSNERSPSSDETISSVDDTDDQSPIEGEEKTKSNVESSSNDDQKPQSTGISTEAIDHKPHEKRGPNYTFRPSIDVHELLEQIIQDKQCGKGEAVNLLIDYLRNQLANAPVKEVIKEVEVVKEVPVEKIVTRPQMPGEVIVSLSDRELQLLNMIRAKRSEAFKRGGKDVMESPGEILKKGLFIRGRLFNQDNQFYTGLSKSDLR